MIKTLVNKFLLLLNIIITSSIYCKIKGYLRYINNLDKKYPKIAKIEEYQVYYLYLTILPCPIIISSTAYILAIFSYQAWFTLTIFLFLIYFLILGQDVSLFFFATLIILVLGGTLNEQQALAGFSNTSILAIITLLLLGKTIETCHILDYLVEKLMGQPRNILFAYIRVLPFIGFISAFINNTPVIAVILPLLQIWSYQSKLSLAKLTMPASYISMLGGTCTLIGSSSNLMVNSLLEEIDRSHMFSFWQPGIIGFPLLIIGGIYLIIAGKWLLPQDNKYQKSPRYSYAIVDIVEPELFHIDGYFGVYKTARENRNNYYNINDIENFGDPSDQGDMDDQSDHSNYSEQFGEQLLNTPPLPSGNSVIWGITECLDKINKNAELYGIQIIPEEEAHLLGLNRTIFRAELKNTTNAGNYEHLYSLIRDKNEVNIHTNLNYRNGDIVIFSPGGKININDFNNLELLSYWQAKKTINYKILLTIFFVISIITMIVLNSLQIFDLYMLATFILILFLLLRLSTWEEVVQQTNWTIYLLIASSVGIGKALKESNIIEETADIVAPIFYHISVLPTLLLLHVMTTLLSSILNNSTVIAIMIPVAHTVTLRYDIDSKMFYAVVMIASSTSFLTSFSYQTNIMIQAVTKYKSIDFIKYGLPLTLICIPITILLSWLFI